MSLLAADVTAIGELAAELAACGRVLDDVDDEVQRRIAQLHGEWDGAASAAQAAAQARWQAAAEQRRAALAELRAAAGVAAANYAAAVAANRRTWCR